MANSDIMFDTRLGHVLLKNYVVFMLTELKQPTGDPEWSPFQTFDPAFTKANTICYNKKIRGNWISKEERNLNSRMFLKVDITKK